VSSNFAIESIRAAVKERNLNKAWFSSSQFEHIILELDKDIEFLSQSDRAHFASVLSRASSVSKPALELFKERIKKILENLPNESSELSDGEDRYYLAKAIKMSSPKWAYDYCIRQLVNEDVAEKARKVWAEVCLSKSVSLEFFLVNLNAAIPQAIQEIESTEHDSSFKRIRRIFASFDHDLAILNLDSGVRFGKECGQLLLKHTASKGPENRKLKQEIGVSYIKSLKKILRLNLEANQDPEVYRVVGRILKWWHPASPPENIRKEVDQVIKIGCKTVYLHAKQGIQNNALRRVLNDVSGSTTINRRLKSLVEEDLSIEERISYWLSHGEEIKQQQQNEVVSELNQSGEDEILAELMILFNDPSFSASHLDQISNSIDAIYPDESEALNSLVHNLRLINQWFASITNKRGLQLIHNPGEIIHYNQSLHEAYGEIDQNANVRIEKPGVKISRYGRPDRILRNPKVRKA